MNKKDFNKLVKELGLDKAMSALKSEKNLLKETTNFSLELTEKSNKIKPLAEDNKKDKEYKKIQRKEIKTKKFNNFIEKLNKNKTLTESEVWFRNKFEPHRLNTDLYNFLYKKKYLLDVINLKYKYIIQVNESIEKKDLYFLKKGYTIFKVKAYDQESFNAFIESRKSLVLV